MRFLGTATFGLFALGWVLATPALASGKLVITSDRAVIIAVNRLPHTVPAGGKVTIEIKDGKEGNQYLTISSMLGEVRYKGQVNVPRNVLVRAEWRGRIWKVIDTKRLDVISIHSDRPYVFRRGSRKPPIPPPSDGLPLHDEYLMAVRDAADYLSRTGKQPGFPSAQ